MATAQHFVDLFLFQWTVVDGSGLGKRIGLSSYNRVVAVEGTCYCTKPCNGACH